MGIPLRALIVEDSKDDALLLVRQLQRGGYDVTYEQVDTAEAMAAALDKQIWDIILSDYVMPQFSGLAALKLWQEKGLDLSFIIVSGKIGEETAIEAMKAGAHDYIMKNNLKRLVPAVKREMEEVEVRLKRRQAEAKYATIIATALNGFWIIDLKGRFLEVNDAYCRLTGYPREELLTMSIPDVEAIEKPEETSQRIEKVVEQGYDHFETRQRRKDGQIIDLEISVQYYNVGEGQIVVFLRDITERKRAEEALRVAEENFRHSLDESPLGIRIVNTEGELLYANQAILDIYGYSSVDELEAMPQQQRYTPESYAEHQKRKESRKLGKPILPNYEISIVRKDGEVRHLSVFRKEVVWGGKTQSQMLYQDITERKNMQEQLIMQDRLASIGQLASGIAHEINNPLTSILGFSQMILEGQLSDDVRADLKIVHSEAERTANIVKGLLTFARQHPLLKEHVNVNKAIDSVLDLRAYEQRVHNIEVIKRFGELPEIIADNFQIQQVFLNIIVNAEYFMIEAHKRGTLTITTERLGDVVRIAIADDGPGIAEEQKMRLFNPFTTTKPVGKGTGLGLSICHGIVTEHGGRIYAKSKLDKGATFFIELPVTQAGIQE